MPDYIKLKDLPVGAVPIGKPKTVKRSVTISLSELPSLSDKQALSEAISKLISMQVLGSAATK